jgi:hypothetical protein
VNQMNTHAAVMAAIPSLCVPLSDVHAFCTSQRANRSQGDQDFAAFGLRHVFIHAASRSSTQEVEKTICCCPFCHSQRVERRGQSFVRSPQPEQIADMPLDVKTTDSSNPFRGGLLGAAMLAIVVGGFFAWNIYESGSAATAVWAAQSK